MRVCVCGDERRHCCVHEAAHAVPAVDLGVPFLHVSVLDEPVGYDEVGGLQKNGGLTVDVDHCCRCGRCGRTGWCSGRRCSR